MKYGPTAFVTGANGFIGSCLTEKLVALGYHVRVLLRKTPPQLALRSGHVEVLHGDLSESAVLKKGVQGTEVVFHLAAKLHLNNPAPALKKDFEQTNVEAARRLAVISCAAKVPRFVFFSTVNVYGCTEDGNVCDEQTPLNPQSWYAQTKADAEKLVLDETSAVVLRLAAVYGRGMKGNYPRLLNALRTGRFVMVGSGRNRRTLVYEEDVCQAAILAAQHPKASGRVYNVTDGQVYTLGQVIAAMSASLGKKPLGLRIPKGLTRNALGFFEDISGLFGLKSPVGRATVDKLTEDLAVKGDKIQQELGFRPSYDLLSGWQECVRVMGEDKSGAIR